VPPGRRGTGALELVRPIALETTSGFLGSKTPDTGLHARWSGWWLTGAEQHVSPQSKEWAETMSRRPPDGELPHDVRPAARPAQAARVFTGPGAGTSFAVESAMHTSTRHAIAWSTGATALLAAVSCGGNQQEPERHLSATQHEAAAVAHDVEAAEHERLYAQSRHDEGNSVQSNSIHCYDPKTPDPDSGGESLQVLRPCWTREERPSRHQLDEARGEREEASRHRAVAASMLRSELEACAGLGDEEKSHSPFFHREDIMRVEEVRTDGEVRGARVLFRKVPGLEVGWMRRAIACHQARAAAMGYPTKVMSYCPLMIAPTSVSVDDIGSAIAVTIVARQDWEIAAVVGRARSLLAASP